MPYSYRKAIMADIPAIHKLINDYAAEGLMLRRPMMLLYEAVRDMIVALDEEGQVVGTGSLHIMGADLAEVRALAVAPSTKGHGVGKAIVESCVEEAKVLGLSRTFALTYQQGFFEKCGFHVIKKETLPQKVWKECVYCDRFHACDEITMIRYLNPAQQSDADLELPVLDLPMVQPPRGE